MEITHDENRLIMKGFIEGYAEASTSPFESSRLAVPSNEAPCPIACQRFKKATAWMNLDWTMLTSGERFDALFHLVLRGEIDNDQRLAIAQKADRLDPWREVSGLSGGGNHGKWWQRYFVLGAFENVAKNMGIVWKNATPEQRQAVQDHTSQLIGQLEMNEWPSHKGCLFFLDALTGGRDCPPDTTIWQFNVKDNSGARMAVAC